jgi:hypothetical protein
LLNDAVNAITLITSKLKKEINHLLLLDVLIDDDSELNIELETFAKNIKKEVFKVINYSFLS